MKADNDKSAGEAKRIADYQMQRRLEELMKATLDELHGNGVSAIIEALSNIEGVGHATPGLAIPSPGEGGMKKSLFIKTDPVGRKNLVEVAGFVACRVDGSRVRAIRSALSVTVANLNSISGKTASGSYKPGGGNYDSSYTLIADEFGTLVQRLIAATAV